MSERRVARRYALALIETAPDTATLESLRSDVETLNRAIRASHDLRVFLRSPVINKVKKKAALSQAFDSALGTAMQRFLQLLCEKRRERVLPEIVTEFELLYDIRSGIVRPLVTSAVELGAPQKSAIEQKLAARLNKIVQPKYIVDPKILGGVSVRIGDTVIDGSVSHQLKEIRDSMLAGVG